MPPPTLVVRLEDVWNIGKRELPKLAAAIHGVHTGLTTNSDAAAAFQGELYKATQREWGALVDSFANKLTITKKHLELAGVALQAVVRDYYATDQENADELREQIPELG